VFYRRLMSVVDDFGRYDARPSILRAACFPLRIDRVREADISRWIAACETAGLIALYEAAGKPYLVLLNIGKPRAESSKYPDPPPEIASRVHVRADEITCAQVRPYSSSDSSTNSDSNKRVADKPPRPRGDSGKPKDAKPPAYPPGTMHAFTEAYVSRWEKMYGRKCTFERAEGKLADTALKAIFSTGGDLAEAIKVLDRYFADDSDFFRGHSMKKLDLKRFLADHSDAYTRDALKMIRGSNGRK
jgi:hypothetical protein